MAAFKTFWRNTPAGETRPLAKRPPGAGRRRHLHAESLATVARPAPALARRPHRVARTTPASANAKRDHDRVRHRISGARMRWYLARPLLAAYLRFCLVGLSCRPRAHHANDALIRIRAVRYKHRRRSATARALSSSSTSNYVCRPSHHNRVVASKALATSRAAARDGRAKRSVMGRTTSYDARGGRDKVKTIRT